MKIEEKFLKYIYSSAPLGEKEFAELNDHAGIFKVNFFEGTFRRPILNKLTNSVKLSQGGVFLLSGYRGTGKTTFLNYITHKINKDKDKNGPADFIVTSVNLSSIKYDFRFEIVYRIISALEEHYRLNFKSDIAEEIPVYLAAKRLKEELEYEINTNTGLKAYGHIPVAGIGVDGSYNKSSTKRDKILFYETELQNLLKELTKDKKRLLFILDELDKLPYFPLEAEEGRQNHKGLSEKEKKNQKKIQQMNWLLQTLGNVKYLLFESGAVFILVVNKDVYDYWKYRYSEEDLFMNLITSVEYLPCYTKEELRLHHDFNITFSDEVATESPETLITLRECFETCNYYESYANPRLYFQNLSRQIKNGEIRIGRAEADYFHNKLKLFALSELIYQYAYENREGEKPFSRLFVAADDLIPVFEAIKESKTPRPDSTQYHLHTLLAEYCYACKKEHEIDVAAFWETEATASEENILYNKINSFLDILKTQDKRDNYPFTNYLIRRLTDFAAIIERHNLIAIKDVVREMDFQEFETGDFMGQFLINLLIPLNIIILRNNNALTINKKYLSVNCGYSPARFFHLGCEAEWQGDFITAFHNYNRFLKEEPFCLEAHHRKLRMLEYMIRLGFYDAQIHLRSQWFDSLLKMKDYFSREKIIALQDKADYRFRRNFFFQSILNDDETDEKNYYKFKLGDDEIYEKRLEELYDSAIEKEPCNATIILRKGYVLSWQEKHISALEMFERANRLYNEGVALIRKGNSYLQLEKYNAAWDCYKKAWESSKSWLQKSFIILRTAEIILKSEETARLITGNFQEEKTQESFTGFCRELTGKCTERNTKLNYLTLFMALKVIIDKTNIPVLEDIKSLINEITPALQTLSRENKDYFAVYKKILPKHCEGIAKRFKPQLEPPACTKIAASEVISAETIQDKAVEEFLRRKDQYVLHLYGKKKSGKTQRITNALLKQPQWKSIWIHTGYNQVNMVAEHLVNLVDILCQSNKQEIYQKLDNIKNIDLLIHELRQKCVALKEYSQDEQEPKIQSRYVLVIDNAENILSLHLSKENGDWQKELFDQWTHFLKSLIALNDDRFCLKIIIITNEHILDIEKLQEYLRFQRHMETKVPPQENDDWEELINDGYSHRIVEQIKNNRDEGKTRLMKLIAGKYENFISLAAEFRSAAARVDKDWEKLFNNSISLIKAIIFVYNLHQIIDYAFGETVAQQNTSKKLWNDLIKNGYIDDTGRIQHKFKMVKNYSDMTFNNHDSSVEKKRAYGILLKEIEKKSELVKTHSLTVAKMLCAPVSDYMFADAGDLMRRYGYGRILAKILEMIDKSWDDPTAEFLSARIKILKGNISFYAYPDQYIKALGDYLQAYEVNKKTIGQCKTNCCFISFLIIYEIINTFYQIYLRRMDGYLPKQTQDVLNKYIGNLNTEFRLKLSGDYLKNYHIRIKYLFEGMIKELKKQRDAIGRRNKDMTICNEHWKKLMKDQTISYKETASGNEKRMEVAESKRDYIKENMAEKDKDIGSVQKLIVDKQPQEQSCFWDFSLAYHEIKLYVKRIINFCKRYRLSPENESYNIDLSRCINSLSEYALNVYSKTADSTFFSSMGEKTWRLANIKELQADIERLKFYLHRDETENIIISDILEYYEEAMKNYVILNCGYHAGQIKKKMDDVRMYRKNLVDENFPNY